MYTVLNKRSFDCRLSCCNSHFLLNYFYLVFICLFAFDFMFLYFFQLCASLQMNPGFYLTIKTIILKVSTRRMKGILVLVYLKPCPGSRRHVQRLVSLKSQNFSGLFRWPQFLLYLRNAVLLNHQTSQFSWFFVH